MDIIFNTNLEYFSAPWALVFYEKPSLITLAGFNTVYLSFTKGVHFGRHYNRLISYLFIYAKS